MNRHPCGSDPYPERCDSISYPKLIQFSKPDPQKLHLFGSKLRVTHQIVRLMLSFWIELPSQTARTMFLDIFANTRQLYIGLDSDL